MCTTSQVHQLLYDTSVESTDESYSSDSDSDFDLSDPEAESRDDATKPGESDVQFEDDICQHLMYPQSQTLKAVIMTTVA